MNKNPGETVLEYLDFHGWSQRDLSRRTGLTPKTISEICNEKAPITPSTALALEKAFQRPAHLWLNRQLHFDEAEARRRELAKSLQWGEWARNFPLKEMKRLKFSLPAGRSDADTLLNFFGVSSPESWNAVWKASAVAYRQTRMFKTREESIAAWVRETEIVAKGLDVAEFDEQRLLSSLDELRRLTRTRADEIMDPVQTICAGAGVAVVWVPEASAVIAGRFVGVETLASQHQACGNAELRAGWSEHLDGYYLHRVSVGVLPRDRGSRDLDFVSDVRFQLGGGLRNLDRGWSLLDVRASVPGRTRDGCCGFWR